jgi:hypothetical protein
MLQIYQKLRVFPCRELKAVETIVIREELPN